MTNISIDLNEIIGQPEGLHLEYKAVLPPSRNIAQLISGFSNTDGGYIILGISETRTGVFVNGLSKDFHANSITHKAIDLLSPRPSVYYEYFSFQDKTVYVIHTQKSEIPILLEGIAYARTGTSIHPIELNTTHFNSGGYEKIFTTNRLLETYSAEATNSRIKLMNHYQSILKITDDLKHTLYPVNTNLPTEIKEGKILLRILFSSVVDNFETYLSDLLYEIFLANPATLKSSQQVTVDEVLSCADIHEFVKYWATQKLSRLQKGSVKGFIKENSQIRDLNIINSSIQNEIEGILQIRHLYSHRNGIIDEKFIQFFRGQHVLNSEHRMSISEVLDKLIFLSEIVKQLDVAATKQFSLDTL